MLILFPKKHKPEDTPWLFPFKKRPPTIEDLCSGKASDVRQVLESNRRKRNDPARGYTKKKQMRSIIDVSFEVFMHPELGKYFARGMDKHERKKNRLAFARKYPMWKTVEKL